MVEHRYKIGHGIAVSYLVPYSNENRYSAACITPTVQQEIEKILLLAIADIEKVQKYYSND
ncbi:MULTISPECIES: hypothetical protein [unclassified Nostoc]|uniref:hypothetical protein n=1 Tax=unclassified Nostoc TaxID=2593658 RepID=UPI002360D8C7|nr:hypothetical protein [Nostoc sp. UHCC 0926]